MKREEGIFAGIKNRILQHLARSLPGAMTLRVTLHRMRGVEIGANVWIGYDAIIETAHPELVTIGNGVSIGIRATIIAHNRESRRVIIEDDAFIGIGAIVLPNVTIGRGAVVTPGSVVSRSVPPMTVVQGNPGVEIATCGVPLKIDASSMKEFLKHLKPIGKKKEASRD